VRALHEVCANRTSASVQGLSAGCKGHLCKHHKHSLIVRAWQMALVAWWQGGRLEPISRGLCTKLGAAQNRDQVQL